MTNLGKWSSTQLSTLMSTEMNSQTNNSTTFSASSYDNTIRNDLYADIELVLGSLSPTGGAYGIIYIFESVDGTNFAPQTTAVINQSSQYLTTLQLDTTASTAQRVVVRNVIIPPAKFFIGYNNQSGVTLNASGNTIKFLTYGFNLNA